MEGGNERRVAIKFCFKAVMLATETLVWVQKAYVNEALNRSSVFSWYFRFRDEKELVEDDERGGRPKSTRNEVNIDAVADLVKHDRQIASRMIESLNIPKTSSSDSERGFGKEKVVCQFCSTLLDTRAKGRSSHILARHIAMADAEKKKFLTKLLREVRPGVLPMTPKQNDRILNGLVRQPLGRRN